MDKEIRPSYEGLRWKYGIGNRSPYFHYPIRNKEDSIMNQFKTIAFKDGSTSLDVRVSVEDGTIWLSAKEMAKLFNIGVSTVRRYIVLTHSNNNDFDVEKKPKMNFSCTYLTNSKPLTLYNEDVILGLANKYKYNKIDLLNTFINNQKKQKENGSNNRINNQCIIYDNGEIKIDVNVSPEEETVWLTQAQIALLFDTTQQNVSLHIKNIIEEGELFDDSVHKDYLYTASDGKQYLTSIYNLDLILAVGYRVKGQRAIEFRKWATNVLKQYLINGYAINDPRVSTYNDIILNIEKETIRLRHDVDLLEQKLDFGIIEAKVFYAGQTFDAYEYLCSIVRKATKNIRIIDPFIDDKVLVILTKTQNVERFIYTTNPGPMRRKDIRSFKTQYGHLEIKYIKKFHDRFIIIDDAECYSIGTSINGVGLKTFAIIQLKNEYIIHNLIDLVSK